MIIDHIGITVSDFKKSVAFYQAALAPLGIELLRTYEDRVAGFGKGGKPEFWIASGDVKSTVHVGFRTNSRAVVKSFYDAGLAAGGTDNGPPGVRAMYHPDYFGAFVKDPDGHNIEAVCHEAYLG